MKTKDDISPRKLKKILKEASQRAVDETFALGLPITILKGNKIVKVYPDGKEELIEIIDKPYITIKKKIFKIG